MAFAVSASFAQIICPPPVTTFTFTFARPVSVDQKVAGATVCDPDVGQTETWSIPSGNTANLLKIAISGNDANFLVNDANAINTSTATSYTFTIRVTDNGVPPLSSSATVILNELNHPPAVADQTFAINENSGNGTSVGTVIATDADVNQNKTFSILSGNTSGAFAINSSTGAIVVANSAALDYETTQRFILIVKVQDNGTGALSAQANITININNVNEAPTISNGAK